MQILREQEQVIYDTKHINVTCLMVEEWAKHSGGMSEEGKMNSILEKSYEKCHWRRTTSAEYWKTSKVSLGSGSVWGQILPHAQYERRRKEQTRVLKHQGNQMQRSKSSWIGCLPKGCHRSLAGYSPWVRKTVRHNLATKQQQLNIVRLDKYLELNISRLQSMGSRRVGHDWAT